MRYLVLFVMLFLFSCQKYGIRKVEGVWELQHVNLCLSGDCFDTLEDRGTRTQYDKIELRLSKDRNAQGRFYNQGSLLYKVDFEYILDEDAGKISFVGPYDGPHPTFFGTNVDIVELEKTSLVYVAIEDFPDEETAYIFRKLQ